jgi:WD40 repeat protein
MLFDPRAGESQVSYYTVHKRPVLALSLCGDFIISASEDQTLAVWDERAQKVLKQLNLFGNEVSVLQLVYCAVVYNLEIHMSPHLVRSNTVGPYMLWQCSNTL